jgi:predicted Zn-dependent protease
MSLESLALPPQVAPKVEHELDVIAERLRPASSPSVASFRVLLAGYTQAHSFSFPPNTVVVTAGLVCAANRPDIVAAAIARELAHLESHDIHVRLAETVDWDTTLDLAHGDMSKLRARMLDYANLDRSPGFTADQDAAAEKRASAMLTSIGIDSTASLEELAQVQVESLNVDTPKTRPTGAEPPAGKPIGNTAKDVEPFDWSSVRDQACELIGD